METKEIRVKAAIAAMKSVIIHKSAMPMCATKLAVQYADALIEQLKKKPNLKFDVVDYINAKNYE